MRRFPGWGREWAGRRFGPGVEPLPPRPSPQGGGGRGRRRGCGGAVGGGGGDVVGDAFARVFDAVADDAVRRGAEAIMHLTTPMRQRNASAKRLGFLGRALAPPCLGRIGLLGLGFFGCALACFRRRRHSERLTHLSIKVLGAHVHV